jgi:hypothetical protein
MGASFDAGHHSVEPNLKLNFAEQRPPPAFPGGHVFRFNLDDGLEQRTAGIRDDARILADAEIIQQPSIAL